MEFKIYKEEDGEIKGCFNCGSKVPLAKTEENEPDYLCEYCTSIYDRYDTENLNLAICMNILEKKIEKMLINKRGKNG